MEKLTMCRICLAEDVRMHLISATHLHKMYEALTTMPFETADNRPLQVCYICCARLQNCYKLKMMCLQSEELFSEMLSKKVLMLKEVISKQKLRTVQVLQMSFDGMIQPPELCNQIKKECEDSEAATSDIAEDTGRDEDSKFSLLVEHVWIDIEKTEWDEQTSAPVPKTTAPTTQTSPTLSNFKKREKLKDSIEELKTDTEIALEDKVLENNLLIVHQTRDYDLNQFNKSNSLLDHNYVEKVISQSSFGIEVKPFQCDKCRKCFNTKLSLEQHFCKRYQCNECKKYFNQKGTLNRHISALHCGEKRYECNICNKCYIQKSHLDNHIRTHTGEKPYQCNECKKYFNQKGTLNRHISALHCGEKRYECNICNKCYIQKSHLDNHIRTHTGEKPYQCKICKKRFNQRCILYRHKLTHTGEKPHQCNVCMKCFNQKNSLYRHMRTHTGEKPFQCNVCMKRFTEKRNLDNHSTRHR